jgi:26S proteasome regulatory subunit T1
MFFDEIDAIGGARFDDGAGGDNEVYRTMLELSNLLEGFDPSAKVFTTLFIFRCFL